MIKAELIQSTENFGHNFKTFKVTFPRIILSELNTHKMLSKNSASSRAIPFNKMVESIQNNPFIPIAWQKNHKGMQGNEYITDKVDLELNISAWLKARDNAISSAEYLNHGVKGGRDNGVTKQICNRLLEPFAYHTCLISGTEWENFFALRCPKYEIDATENGIKGIKTVRSRKDYIKEASKNSEENYWESFTEIDWLKINKGQAEIHMMALAEAIWDAYNENNLKERPIDEWHIPYGNDVQLSYTDYDNSGFEKEEGTIKRIKIATARCARISYTTFGEEKEHTYEKDIQLHDNLAKSGHWSPFEHIGRKMTKKEYEYNTREFIVNQEQFKEYVKRNRSETYDVVTLAEHKDKILIIEYGWSGNMRGFIQYRKMFNNENIQKSINETIEQN